MLKSTLRVLFLAAEADPLVKVGGLGDVAGSLPLALRALSRTERAGSQLGEPSPQVDVRLALPFYGLLRQRFAGLSVMANVRLPFEDGWAEAEACQIDLDGMPVYLIAGPFLSPEAPVYSSDDYSNGIKFTFFSLAALELARSLGWSPCILHANDWHTAPAVYALSLQRRADPFFSNTASLLSLHNLPFMGVGAGRALAAFGLPPATASPLPWWAQDMPLPLGLLTADHIVAVSPTYAAEILSPEFGFGLHDFLRSRSDRISGILNGLDVKRWDPQADPHLPVNFDVASLEARLGNKTALQVEFNLQQDLGVPLLAMISRMDIQKGVDLLPEALRLLVSSPSYAGQPWQLIVLGTGDSSLEQAVRRLEDEFPSRARVAIRFDDSLSRRIYAGADMLVIPSRYEPCGLAQMIAMRYGCVPVARAIGGLRDTIQDYACSPDSTGFLFEEEAPEALAAALGRALLLYADRPAWQALQRRGMLRDFSWQRSARQYLDLYEFLADERQTIN